LQAASNWDDNSVRLRAGLPSGETWTGWGNGLTGTSTKFSKDKCVDLHLGRKRPLHQSRLGTDWLGSSTAEKEWFCRQQAAHEPAACPDSRECQQHPGLYSQAQSQQIEGSDYATSTQHSRPSPVLGSAVQEGH